MVSPEAGAEVPAEVEEWVPVAAVDLKGRRIPPGGGGGMGGPPGGGRGGRPNGPGNESTSKPIKIWAKIKLAGASETK